MPRVLASVNGRTHIPVKGGLSQIYLYVHIQSAFGDNSVCVLASACESACVRARLVVPENVLRRHRILSSFHSFTHDAYRCASSTKSNLGTGSTVRIAGQFFGTLEIGKSNHFHCIQCAPSAMQRFAKEKIEIKMHTAILCTVSVYRVCACA